MKVLNSFLILSLLTLYSDVCCCPHLQLKSSGFQAFFCYWYYLSILKIVCLLVYSLELGCNQYTIQYDHFACSCSFCCCGFSKHCIHNFSRWCPKSWSTWRFWCHLIFHCFMGANFHFHLVVGDVDTIVLIGDIVFHFIPSTKPILLYVVLGLQSFVTQS